MDTLGFNFRYQVSVFVQLDEAPRKFSYYHEEHRLEGQTKVFQVS